MKLIKTTEAVGHVLCHDITQIIKDVKKGPAFRKGHIVTEEDIPVLLSLGKDNLYVWEKQEGMLHENETAEILRAICMSDNMTASEVKEGKIELSSTIDGLFKVDTERLDRINALGEIIIATRHGNIPVRKGDKLAGMRVIPLVIEQGKMDRALAEAGDSTILQVLPFVHKKAGLVITGNEVYHKRIPDAFGPVIEAKLSEYGVDILGKTFMDDNAERITNAIQQYIDSGADLIICTGGMSVDPDDTTPTAIKNTGAKLVTYGAPVLPGAMFLLAYYEDGEKTVPILGLPGCVMYAKRTIFDLVLPRIMAGERLAAEDLTRLGEGGLCLDCPVCTYPNCGFGK
jgi:molybdenum cofactor synthesis domain-containing protein